MEGSGLNINVADVANARRIVNLAVNRLNMVPNASIASQRRSLLGGGQQYSGERDYNTVLGRDEEISFDKYLRLYERGGIAGQLIDGFAQDTWGEPPQITEDGSDETEFVKVWDELVQRLHIWDVLSRADALSGIGQYGALMFGLAGSEDPAEPVKRNSIKGPEGLLWLRPFHQGDAEIAGFDRNEQSERCGFPESYRITMDAESDAIEVHQSRVLHLCWHRTSSEVYGRPWLERAYDTLMDMLYKILGGSAESYWLNQRKPTLLTTQEGWDFDVNDSTDMDSVEDQLQALVHDLGRFLIAPGWGVQEIASPAVADPQGPFGVHMDNIAGTTRMPKHIMLGSAAGELASSQADDRRWAGVIRRRQNTYAQPRILERFIDRLIWFGVLPQPANGYEIGAEDDEGRRNWPSIIQMTAEQEAAIAQQRATAVKQFQDPTTGDMDLTKKERRVILGVTPEVPEGMEDDEPEQPAAVPEAQPGAEPEAEPEAPEPGPVDDVPELTPPEPVGEPDEETEAARVNALFVGSHEPTIVTSICPLPDCNSTTAESYPGHGPLLRCTECKRTYDPTVEGAGGNIIQTQAKKGPGPGWWGPPKGTHGRGSSGGDIGVELTGFTKEEELEIKAALDAMPLKDVEGLGRIAADHTLERRNVSGKYVPEIKTDYHTTPPTVYLAPGKVTKALVLHEMGHHVTIGQHNRYHTQQGVRQAINDKLLPVLKSGEYGSLASLGLRRYSVSRATEFLADLYVLRSRGYTSQLEDLADSVYDVLDMDIEEWF